MAQGLPELHDRALAVTRDYVAGVGENQWNGPSPCEGWDVRELVNHIVGGNFWAGELARGKTIDEVGDRLDGDILGDDPTAAYDESARAASEAFQAPGAMEAPCAVSYGPVPGEVYLGHRFIDVVVHRWDVAKATGQDPTLPADLVLECTEVATPMDAMLRMPGVCGPAVAVADDASPQDRLVAFLGRNP